MRDDTGPTPMIPDYLRLSPWLSDDEKLFWTSVIPAIELLQTMLPQMLDVIAGCAMNGTRRMAGMLVMIAHALIHNHSDLSLGVLVDMANQTNLFCPKNQEA